MTQTVAREIIGNYRPAPSTNISDLNAGIKTTIQKIIYFVKVNDFDSPYLEKLLSYEYSFDLTKLTKTAKKKLAKKMLRVNHKLSIRNSNIFLSFLRTRVMSIEIESLKIKPSKAEQEIATARGIYKKLQAELNKARMDYKEKKKEYHKLGKTYFGL